MRRYKILVVDDEHLIRWSLEQNLKKQGYDVLACGSGEEALRLAQEESPDLVLLDIQLPDINGVEVLERIRDIDEEMIVIMVTAIGVLETAVRAMRTGAYDYINKPFNLDELAIVIKKALETQELKREVAQLRTNQPKKFNIDSIVSESDDMTRILNMVYKIAQSDAGTVLIQGESGTGKELIAKAIHYESARSDRPFVAINCAAVPETLLESELMGHEKGAFTDARVQKKGLFEIADGGTVFLDEIGDMPLSIQAKLLRVLEDRVFRRVGGTKDIHVDVRIVSATNKDLLVAIEEKAFRNDLYYRLQVIPLLLPPLRERRDDILPLTRAFIEDFNKEFGKSVKGLSVQAEEFLLAYDWPGNVRELRNVIERAIILESDEIMQLEHLPLEIVSKSTATPDVGSLTFILPPQGIDIEDVERELINQALQATEGNQSQAARKLNLGIDAFRYRMKKFKLL
ncbi:MAG TPA: sigma-54 dependent transcriptional regulator [Geopsychrobacteraceae bacterium]|nr:sigma-54 dependent transcriptional regulator [Geopsychrobacteraceae bacterium]